MAKTIIDDFRDQTVAVQGSDNVVTVKSSGRLDVFNHAAIYDDGFGTGNDYVVNGFVSTSSANPLQTAIYLRGQESSVTVGASGLVMALNGVHVGGTGSAVVNRGTVVGTDGSAVVVGNGTLDNFGILSGSQAVAIYGGTVTNEAKGEIYGRGYGVTSENGNSPTLDVKLVNHGLISMPTGHYAYFGGDAVDTIVNDGRIVGNISLAGGSDTINTRGGVITGYINGGEGDDTLVTDNAKYQLRETDNAGNDTVRASVSYAIGSGLHVENLSLTGSKDINGTGNEFSNRLIGNSGDNKLNGGLEGDYLSGGKGNDRLTGGDGLDNFEFGTGFGKDTVTDISADETLDLRGWKGVSSLIDILGRASDHGDDVWIKIDKDTLVLEDFQKNDLDTLVYVF